MTIFSDNPVFTREGKLFKHNLVFNSYGNEKLCTFAINYNISEEIQNFLKYKISDTALNFLIKNIRPSKYVCEILEKIIDNLPENFNNLSIEERDKIFEENLIVQQFSYEEKIDKDLKDRIESKSIKEYLYNIEQLLFSIKLKLY